MFYEKYLSKVEKKLESYFDLTRDIALAGVPIALKADAHRRNERYLLTKSNTMYAYDNHEHFLFIKAPQLTLETLQAQVSDLVNYILEHHVADEDHMSTDYSLVYLVQSDQRDIVDFVKAFKRRKRYQWGLKGRLHIGLVLVSSTGRVYYSIDRRKKHFKFLEVL